MRFDMEKIKIIWLLTLIFTITFSCQKNKYKLRPKISQKAEIYQTGYSTWYGPRFQGRKTATGEIYDMYQYTAAHRTLPLNTLIRVQNIENKAWTVVRINDRGPVRKTLILDLSKIAAIELNITEKGSAKVRIQILSESKNPLKRIVQTYVNLNKQLPN